MKVLVGSQNPVKINAVKRAFSHYFDDVEVVGKSVPSGVADQPFDEETFDGACNRARALANEEADFYVGLEGGLFRRKEGLLAQAVMCVIAKGGKESIGVSPGFFLPKAFDEGLASGKEMGDIGNEFFGQENIKQHGGVSGALTKGVLTREEMYTPGVIFALYPFLN